MMLTQRRLYELSLVHLRLGRVSNLPTVWSNCLAAWMLAGGAVAPNLLLMMIAVTLFYVGGMYLNDACDVEYDLVDHPGRPIPNLEITRNAVYGWGFSYLLLGLMIAWSDGWRTGLMATLLALTILGYDIFHKRIAWAPLLMASCRGLTYLVMAASAQNRFDGRLIGWTLALTAYVAGLSWAAKDESRSALSRYSPLILLFLPALLNLAPVVTPLRATYSAAFAIWIGYCLFLMFSARYRDIRQGVGNLIAGICLVDLLAASRVLESTETQFHIAVLFGITLLAQRVIPGT